jgi:hypothetical protein
MALAAASDLGSEVSDRRVGQLIFLKAEALEAGHDHPSSYQYSADLDYRRPVAVVEGYEQPARFSLPLPQPLHDSAPNSSK